VLLAVIDRARTKRVTRYEIASRNCAGLRMSRKIVDTRRDEISDRSSDTREASAHMDAPNIELQVANALAAGDHRGAATMLVRLYASDVYALCRAMVRDTTLAEDLSQDVFGRAFAALDGFRNESSIRTWLLRIARNRCLDHIAQTKRDPFDAHDDNDIDDHPAPVQLAPEILANREDAQRALGAVTESERALVVLHFGHGVGYPELAEAFGLKEGTLRMRISRAVAKMREAIAPEGVPPAAPLAAPFIVPRSPLAAPVPSSAYKAPVVGSASRARMSEPRPAVPGRALTPTPPSLVPPTIAVLFENAPTSLRERLEQLAAAT
jgi:RNA polymerase sigma-70 factor (ECF subfamily)